MQIPNRVQGNNQYLLTISLTRIPDSIFIIVTGAENPT